MRRPHARTGIALAAAIAVLAAGVGGAAAGPSAQAAAKDDVTLTLMYPNTVQNAWTKTIEDFEHKYPNIKINAQYVDGITGNTLLATQLQAGNGARPLLGRRRHRLARPRSGTQARPASCSTSRAARWSSGSRRTASSTSRPAARSTAGRWR